MASTPTSSVGGGLSLSVSLPPPDRVPAIERVKECLFQRSHVLKARGQNPIHRRERLD